MLPIKSQSDPVTVRKWTLWPEAKGDPRKVVTCDPKEIQSGKGRRTAPG